MADTASEVDVLLEQVAELRGMVRLARARLRTARQRADYAPGYDRERRTLLRREFQRMVLCAEDAGPGKAEAF